MSLPTTETPHPEVVQIRAGHFDERGSYASFRTRGTTDWLMIYTRRGSGRVGHAAGELITGVGDVTLLEPNTRHDYGLAVLGGHWELVWAHFHPRTEWQPWLLFPVVARGLRSLKLTDAATRGRIEERLIAMNRLANGPERHAESLAMNALEEVLLRCDLENPEATGRRLDPRIRRALDFLCADPKREVSLPELASRVALSRSRFAHLFREQVGTTPQRFHEDQRLGRARELLELTDRSVAQIAEDLGFGSPFYFSLRFKRAFGKSPSHYREARRRKPH